MKIGGVDPRKLSAIYDLVLPRGDGFIVFKAHGIQNMDEFTRLCPEPTAPVKRTRNGIEPDTGNKNYQGVLEEYNKRRMGYMVVKSLEPSDIEWDSVDIGIPGTWPMWEAELKNSGLTQIECNRVVALVLEANCLDENKLKQARDVFHAGLQQGLGESYGPSTEQPSTQLGEPANA